jgi:hypothetical protein
MYLSNLKSHIQSVYPEHVEGRQSAPICGQAAVRPTAGTRLHTIPARRLVRRSFSEGGSLGEGGSHNLTYPHIYPPVEGIFHFFRRSKYTNPINLYKNAYFSQTKSDKTRHILFSFGIKPSVYLISSKKEVNRSKLLA